MIITTRELSDIIDVVKVGVDESSFGPILSVANPADVTKKQINTMAWNVFQMSFNTVLTGYLKQKIEINASQDDNSR